jgi:hypothetical protein
MEAAVASMKRETFHASKGLIWAVPLATPNATIYLVTQLPAFSLVLRGNGGSYIAVKNRARCR